MFFFALYLREKIKKNIEKATIRVNTRLNGSNSIHVLPVPLPGQSGDAIGYVWLSIMPKP
jgi:hypothetical protein